MTHDLSLGNYISDRPLILRHGRIVEMGPTEQVFGIRAIPTRSPPRLGAAAAREMEPRMATGRAPRSRSPWRRYRVS